MNRHTLIRALDFGIMAVLLASPAVSQDVVQKDNAFTLKTSTEVVLVNVTVKDSKGNFVRDLKQDDFTVTEDGKNQKILSLDVENTDALNIAGEVQTANLLGELNGATASKIEAEVKTRGTQPSPTAYTRDTFRDRRLVVMFFDLTSMQPEEIERGVKSAQKFVDEQMKPADLVSVVSISTRLDVDQDFTSNKEDLKKALEGLDPNSADAFAGDTAADAADADATDTSTDAAFSADTSETDIFNTDRKLDAMRTMFETLQGIEQKKSVLFFSGGLRTSGIDNQTSLRAAVNAANRANTSIYAVDLRGLQAVIAGGDASRASQRGANAFNGRGARQAFTQQQSSQDTLVTLSRDTGGQAFLNSNEFSTPFAKVQEDTSMYYVLGYSSTNSNKDGKYRDIRVTVKLKDVRIVSARRGYYAETDFAHMAKESKEKQLQDELTADLPSTDLPVYLSTGYFRLDDTRYYVPVSIVVPGNVVPLVRQGEQDHATLDILGAVIDGGRGGPGGPGGGDRGGDRGGNRGGDRGFDRGGPGGGGRGPGGPNQGPRVISQIKDTVKLAVNAEQDVKRKNIQYDAGFLLPPGRFRLRFIVRENQTGQVGSFETDVFVPNLLQAPVKVSSVVASSQKQAAKPKKDDPLNRNGMSLIPSVTHVFSKDQHLYLFYEVYDPKHPDDVDVKEKNVARLLTNATFFKGNTKALETPLVEVNQINSPERRAATIELDIPLNQLKAGFYTCQINVVDDAAGQFVFPRLALLVR